MHAHKCMRSHYQFSYHIYISHIYKTLEGDSKDYSLDNREKWELEVNLVITDEDLKLSCRKEHKITNSPIWKEFEWKVKMRFFLILVTSEFGCSSNKIWRGFGIIQHYLCIGKKHPT